MSKAAKFKQNYQEVNLAKTLYHKLALSEFTNSRENRHRKNVISFAYFVRCINSNSQNLFLLDRPLISLLRHATRMSISKKISTSECVAWPILLCIGVLTLLDDSSDGSLTSALNKTDSSLKSALNALISLKTDSSLKSALNARSSLRTDASRLVRNSAIKSWDIYIKLLKPQQTLQENSNGILNSRRIIIDQDEATIYN